MSPLLLALGTYAVTLIEMGRLIASAGRSRGAAGTGCVDEFGGTHVATQFVQIAGLPILPVESRVFLEEAAPASHEDLTPGTDAGMTFAGGPSSTTIATSLPVPLDRRSIAAAYLRWYGSALAFLAFLKLLVLGGLAPAAGIFDLLPLPLAAPAILAAGAGWLLGRLSREEKARRIVYWDYTGHFADVAVLGDARLTLRAQVAREVARRARALTGSSYREGFDPEHEWRRVAAAPRSLSPTLPTAADPSFLRAALTLTRIEWSLSTGRERARLGREFARIWENLETAQPTLLSEVDSYSLR